MKLMPDKLAKMSCSGHLEKVAECRFISTYKTNDNPNLVSVAFYRDDFEKHQFRNRFVMDGMK